VDTDYQSTQFRQTFGPRKREYSNSCGAASGPPESSELFDDIVVVASLEAGFNGKRTLKLLGPEGIVKLLHLGPSVR
jgi:hypothetical protein